MLNVTLNNFILITGEEDRDCPLKTEPVRPWKFCQLPQWYTTLAKGPVRHHVLLRRAPRSFTDFPHLLVLRHLAVMCLPHTQMSSLSIHSVAPCAGPSSKRGHLSHSALTPTSHAGTPLPSGRLWLLTQGFSQFSPLQCGRPTHPAQAITPHTWLPLHGMLFSPNSSCYQFARLPSSWNVFPAPVACLHPSQGSSPMYMPSWRFAGFVPDHHRSFNAHTLQCQRLLHSPHQELSNWRVQEKKGRGRRKRRKRFPL